jgi:hypothetical protein
MSTVATIARRLRRCGWLALFAVVCGGVVAVLSEQPASAQRRPFTIDWPDFHPTGILSADGQRVRVSGPFGCEPEAGSFEIQATVTQASTGAVARGKVVGNCEGRLLTFHVDTRPTGTFAELGRTFEEGTALVTGFSFTYQGRAITTLEQWIQFITLEREAP